ncbi:MAG TPA: DUF4157 domain-containing protein [Caulobacteraceae bacterium]|nr:DUF4157 domain-containing protein [Caulobacteraceae bacterium]
MHAVGRTIAAPLAGMLMLALAACSGEPVSIQFSPPTQWRSDLQSSLDEAQVRAERAAREATNESLRYLRDRPPPPQSAPAFAAAIRYSRNEARASGARRLPAHIRRELAPYFPREVLDQVRWNLPGRRASIGSFVVGWYFDQGAVTLDDVIVFSDKRLAEDPLFWAHELTHVEQYRRLGVDGFARRYIADWRSLEREARDKTLAIRKDMRRRG